MKWGIIIFIIILVATYMTGLVNSAFNKRIKPKAEKCGHKFSGLTRTATGKFKIVFRVCWISILVFFLLIFVPYILCRLNENIPIETASAVSQMSRLVLVFLVLPPTIICNAILLGREMKRYLTAKEIREAREEAEDDIKKRVKILTFVTLGLFSLGFAVVNGLGSSISNAGKDIGTGPYDEKDG